MPGGSGSRADPFARISAAGGGVVISLASGTHREAAGSLAVPAGTTLWGCAGSIVEDVEIGIGGAGIEIRGVRLSGSPVRIERGGDARLIGVIAGGAMGELVHVAGGALEIRGSLLRGAGGTGVLATGGSRVRVIGSAVEETTGQGIYARGQAARIDVIGSAIRRVVPRSTGYGTGVRAEGQGAVHVVDSIVEGSTGTGVSAFGDLTQAVLRGTVVRGTRASLVSSGNEETGAGIGLAGGARLSLERVLVEDSRVAGILIGHQATTATASHLAVLDTLGRDSDGAAEGAIGVELGAGAVFARVFVEAAVEHGAIARGTGSRLRLEDAAIRDVSRWGDHEGSGAGVHGTDRAHVELARVSIEATTRRGIRAGGNSELVATDLTIRSVSDESAVGLWVSGDSYSIVDRVEIDGVSGIGINTLGLAHLTATDVSVRRAKLGALLSSGGSRVAIERASFTGNQFLGAGAVHHSTLIELTDATISGTANADQCSTVACTGRGLHSSEMALIKATRFAILRNSTYGVVIDPNAEMDLSQGIIDGHGVGALVSNDRFAAERLLDRVTFGANQIDLDVPND
jgi:hypothetical protein